VLDVNLNTSLVIEPSIVIEGPMPSKLMLESSVIFTLLFLGILKKALCPRASSRTKEPARCGLNIWSFYSYSTPTLATKVQSVLLLCTVGGVKGGAEF
jgi:hypothetical protein